MGLWIYEHECRCPQIPEDSVRWPGAEVINRYELLDLDAENKQVFLTAEPSL